LTKQIYIVGHLHTYEACVYSPVSCCFYGPAEPTIKAKNEEKIGLIIIIVIVIAAQLLVAISEEWPVRNEQFQLKFFKSCELRLGWPAAFVLARN